MFEIEPDRIGKMALLLAMTTREEEEAMKALVKEKYPKFKIGITFLSGNRHEVMKNMAKAAIGCVTQNHVIRMDKGEIHATIHASLEALTCITNHILVDTNLKLKLAAVSDGSWVAIALYGDSAVHPLTNHERAGLGVMNL